MFHKHQSKLKSLCLLTVVSGGLALISASAVTGDLKLTAPESPSKKSHDLPGGGKVIINQFSTKSLDLPTDNFDNDSAPKRLAVVEDEANRFNTNTLDFNEPRKSEHAANLESEQARPQEINSTSISALPTFISMIVAPKNNRQAEDNNLVRIAPVVESDIDDSTEEPLLPSLDFDSDELKSDSTFASEYDDNVQPEAVQDFTPQLALNAAVNQPNADLELRPEDLNANDAETLDLDEPVVEQDLTTNSSDQLELLPEPAGDEQDLSEPSLGAADDSHQEPAADNSGEAKEGAPQSSDNLTGSPGAMETYSPTTLPGDAGILNDACIDDCGCQAVWFEDCCAPWVAQFDTLLLFRQGGDTFAPLINCNCNLNVVRPRAGDSWDTGLRAWLRKDNVIGCWGVESIYWQMDDWQDRFSHTGDQNTLVGVNLGTGTSAISYQSELNTFELNATKYLTNWTQIGIGFRWLNLDEIAIATGSGNLVANLNRRAVTNNDLYGGQLVLNHTFWDRGGDIVVSARAAAGVYQNQIDRLTSGFGTSPLADDRTSFVGEGELTAQYFLTDNCSLQIGYQLMWLTNVALAIDQFFDAGAIRSDSDLFLNGLTFGFGYQW